jgi:transketolase
MADRQEQMEKLHKLATMIRHYILAATTRAGSGHPSSSLSATDLMTGLLFGGGFRYDPDRPDYPNNDRLIFSKGHASPLFYALWLAAGRLSEEEMLTYRQFGSLLEGHPTAAFPYAEAATGSLGQGLSIGVGMALNARYLDKLPYRTYVLLGDSEMAEGSQWEAIQLAAHYRLDNLIGVIDVNRLGQRGETMYGHDLHAYERRLAAFGWQPILIDGHSFTEILAAYEQARQAKDKPVMIIARTVKGKGAAAVENLNGWHGKILSTADYQRALEELGQVDCAVRGQIPLPEAMEPERRPADEAAPFSYPPDQPVATRKAYGNALKRLYPGFPELVSLDAEVSNSTYAEVFLDAYPDRFFEMYIAEQNMVGAALGLALRGKLPFVSTFAAFFSRAYDQIRMSQYSDANIKLVGSHAGVSIGEDGPSQMGLEDLAMFRAILGSVVLYPADAPATERLVEEAARHRGIVYLRTTRAATPILYGPEERFPIGGSKVLRSGDKDMLTVVSAGITLFEALAAYEELKKEGIFIRVIDLYSIKPLDESALQEAASATRAILTVEDHYPEGGLGEAVKSALATAAVPVFSLAVRKKPKSGKPEELLDYEEISRQAIASNIRIILEVETV